MGFDNPVGDGKTETDAGGIGMLVAMMNGISAKWSGTALPENVRGQGRGNAEPGRQVERTLHGRSGVTAGYWEAKPGAGRGRA